MVIECSIERRQASIGARWKCLYNVTNSPRVDSYYICLVIREPGLGKSELALAMVQSQDGGLELVQHQPQPACVLFPTGSTEGDVVQVGAGTRHSQWRHVHVSLVDSRGGRHSKKKRRPTLCWPFQVLTINTTAGSGVTGCCWCALAKPTVLYTLPPRSWVKASYAVGSGYTAFWDGAFTVLRYSPQRRNWQLRFLINTKGVAHSRCRIGSKMPCFSNQSSSATTT